MMRGKWLVVSVLLLGLMLGAVAGLGLAQGREPGGAAAPQALAGTGFTYQGNLNRGGSPYDGTCDFQFSLHDDPGDGAQIGSTQTIAGVDVDAGLFTVVVNGGNEFGAGAFNGEGRWLAIEVQCTGDGSYTPLDPRQPLSPAPYALALPGLWTEQNATSPNLVGGYWENSVGAGVTGATVGGGGQSDSPNQVLANFGTLAGGDNNRVDSPFASIGGGGSNIATGFGATISGGGVNSTDGQAATVGGGWGNTAVLSYTTVAGGQDNAALRHHATVGGGEANTVEGGYATVSGGVSNTVSGPWATLGGGISNTITANGHQATVGGGFGNVADGTNTTVSGGQANTASDLNATVGGGYNNLASVDHATVGGGTGNTASGYEGSTVGGGGSNTASHWYATVGGGLTNTASGHYTTIPGGREAVATHFGEMSYASGMFAATGDAQTSIYVLRNTSEGVSQAELFLNGNNSRLTIAEDRTLTFDILVVGRSEGGFAGGYEIRGVIKNSGGATAFVGTPTVVELGEDYAGFGVSVEALDSYDTLVLRAGNTGPGTFGTIRWVATVRTVEVGW